MREFLRIATFSVGGLLAMLGILLLIATLIPGSADKGEPIWGVVIATFLLAGGMAVCTLAPKVPHPAASMQTMSPEEKMVQNIRDFPKKHRSRIGALAVLSATMLCGLLFTLWQGRKLDAMVTPELFRLTDASGNADDVLSTQLSSVYVLAGAKAKVLLHTYWFAAWTGFCIGALTIEVGGLTKPGLTLAMWERIERLEREIKDLQQRG
jgi:hypothetical protein